MHITTLNHAAQFELIVVVSSNRPQLVIDYSDEVGTVSSTSRAPNNVRITLTGKPTL